MTDTSKVEAVVKELDAFQAAAATIGTATDPVVHQYLLNLNLLISRVREILRGSPATAAGILEFYKGKSKG